ncbi:MAG TPA: AMIN domain-containing protein [Nostocaceae cyanobacterium]|nr:AMIN domain-containing protein [Nostocaceae cyanobacterium]
MNIPIKSTHPYLSHQNILKVSLLSLFTTTILTPQLSYANPVIKLNNWQFNPKSQQLEINLSATTTPQYFYLAEPPRLVVDLPNTQLGKVITQQNYKGKVQRIRISQMNPTVTRIVLDLAPGNFVDPNQVQLQPISRKNPTRWVLRPLISYHSTSSPSKPLPNVNNSNNPFPQPSFTLPPPSSNSGNSPQQTTVTVPPLNAENSPPFPNPQRNSNNSGVSISNYGNYVIEVPQVPIIEFGQPLPK